MQYILQRMTLPCLNNGVHVVRHDAPGQEQIPVPIEVQKRILYEPCDRLFTQPASAMARIFVLVNPLAESNLPRISVRKIFGPLQLFLPFFYYCFGNGVVEPEGD